MHGPKPDIFQFDELYKVAHDFFEHFALDLFPLGNNIVLLADDTEKMA